MDAESLKAEVRQAVIALELIAKHGALSFGDGYRQVGVNFSLRACEMAAAITGADRTFCKMLNHKFRSDACDLMFNRALAEI